MNTDHSIGFENGGPVLTVEFDFASLDAGVDEPADRIDAAVQRERARLTQQFSDAQLELLTWLDERVLDCSLDSGRQTKLKVAIVLLSTRPAALGLGAKPTLTKLAAKHGVPKQKVSQINTAFADRFGFFSSVMKSAATRQKLAARFAHKPKTVRKMRRDEGTTTEQMLMFENEPFFTRPRYKGDSQPEV